MLGEFEYILLSAAATLGDEAYGASIRLEIESTARRKCSIGALYATIDRLEAKGLLSTWMSEGTAERGGRSRRMVKVTPAGIRAASDFYSSMMRVSRNAAWANSKQRGAL